MMIKTKKAHTQNYSQGRRIPIKYIVIHYTGNYGDTAKNNADFFAREPVTPKRSAHYFVDETEIWNSVPVDSVAWHVSSSAAIHQDCRNTNSIGIEICMNDKQGTLRLASIEQAVKLTRTLMALHNVPIDRVLRHYDVTHKSCPEPMVTNPKLWQEFKTKLQEEETAKMKYYEKLDEIPAGELRDTIKLLIERNVIAGTGGGLHLSEDMVRMFVFMRRLGLYA